MEIKKCLLFIEIFRSPELQFTKSNLDVFKTQNSDVMVFDFDNFSDSTTILVAGKLLDESEKTAILIQSEAGGNTYPLLKFFEKILQSEKKREVILLNPSPMLSKMFDIKSLSVHKNTEWHQVNTILNEYFDD